MACALTIGAGYLPFLLASQGHPWAVMEEECRDAVLHPDILLQQGGTGLGLWRG